MPVKGLTKIVMLGAQAVGKTSIVEQIVYGNYVPNKVRLQQVFSHQCSITISICETCIKKVGMKLRRQHVMM